MKRVFLGAILLFLSVGYHVDAQSYEAPKSYILKTKEDFIKYEADVINTVDWMQQTPWADQPEKQLAANKFLTDWATGSPYVTVEIGQPMLRLCKKNPQLLLTYMGQFIKYALQHKTDFTKTQANVFAVKAMIVKYGMETKRKEDNAMQKLIIYDQQGHLEEWVKDNLDKLEN